MKNVSADSPSARTWLFLSQLTDDPNALAVRMAQQRVALRLLNPSPSGEVALAMAATLLLRMDQACPSLSLTAPVTRATRIPGIDDSSLYEALAEAHQGFESINRYSDTGDGADVDFAFSAGLDGIPVGSLGWIAQLGIDGAESRGNAVAAAFAGVLSANEAIKAVLTGAGVPLRRVPTAWRGSVSLWDYTLEGGDPGPVLQPDLDLDDTAFVGCGGVLAATFWSLGLFDLHGSPLLIDDDIVDITNLNRLLFARYGDLGEPKVEVAGRFLRASGSTPTPLNVRWEDASVDSPNLAIVSVDDDSVRRRVQESMPRLILNGGTSDTGEFQVSRHDFLTDACLSCISHGDTVARSLEENVARHLGVPLRELTMRINTDEPLPASVIAESNLPSEIRDQAKGLSARELVLRFCDELTITRGDAVSMPTLSAAPGVVLAAEIIKTRERATMRAEQLGRDNIVRGSVLRGPHRRWLMSLKKRAGCICQDSAYVGYFERKHGLL